MNLNQCREGECAGSGVFVVALRDENEWKYKASFETRASSMTSMITVIDDIPNSIFFRAFLLLFTHMNVCLPNR